MKRDEATRNARLVAGLGLTFTGLDALRREVEAVWAGLARQREAVGEASALLDRATALVAKVDEIRSEAERVAAAVDAADEAVTAREQALNARLAVEAEEARRLRQAEVESVDEALSIREAAVRAREEVIAAAKQKLDQRAADLSRATTETAARD